MDKIKIPNRFFQILTLSSQAPEWINGELVSNTLGIKFKGALFDLKSSDYIKFQSQGTSLGFEDRKLYIIENININLKDEIIDHLGNKFRVVGKEDYRQNGHANLNFNTSYVKVHLVSGKEYMIHDEHFNTSYVKVHHI